VPFWMFGVIVPAIVAVIGSAAIGIILVVGLVLVVLAVGRWIKRRSTSEWS